MTLKKTGSVYKTWYEDSCHIREDIIRRNKIYRDMIKYQTLFGGGFEINWTGMKREGEDPIVVWKLETKEACAMDAVTKMFEETVEKHETKKSNLSN
jgi:hypothetical protein